MLLLKVISITNYFGSRQTKPAMNLSVSLTLTHNRTAYGNVTAGLAVSMYSSRHCNTLGQSSTIDPSSYCDTLPLARYDRALFLLHHWTWAIFLEDSTYALVGLLMKTYEPLYVSTDPYMFQLTFPQKL